MGTFDTSDEIFDALDKNQIAFGIDQQPYLQGYLPIPLLTYFSYSKQHLQNEFIESGPSFVTSSPSEQEQICEVNLFEVCDDSDLPSGVTKEETADDSANVGLIVGLVFGGLGLVLAIAVVVHCRSRSHQEPTDEVPTEVKAAGSLGSDLEEEEQQQPQQTGGAEDKSKPILV
jgi:hypothetical protein